MLINNTQVTPLAHHRDMNSTTNRTGVLIVRMWIEASHQQGLRARITQSLDTTAGEESVALAASTDDICAVVKQWVEDFASPPSPDWNGLRKIDESGNGS